MSVSIVLYRTLVASVTIAIAQVVREEEHAMAPEKARAEHDVGVALADQLDELRILFRRVLEVGVLNDDEIAGDRRESAAQRRALAGVGCRSSVKPSSCCRLSRISLDAVGRSVVDDDELDAERDGEHAADDRLDRGTLVEHGHDDREQRISGNGRARFDLTHGHENVPYGPGSGNGLIPIETPVAEDALRVRRLVVFAPNWLGDAVMALPAIADVRRSAPGATLAVAARPSIAPLFALVPGIDDVLMLEGGQPAGRDVAALRERHVRRRAAAAELASNGAARVARGHRGALGLPHRLSRRRC